MAKTDALSGIKSLSGRVLRGVLIGVVRFYQYVISPVIGPRCRFWPTCSHYAIDAIRFHGAWKGSLMALKRLGRCHPFHPGGVDPVPPGPFEKSCHCRDEADSGADTRAPRSSDSPDR